MSALPPIPRPPAERWKDFRFHGMPFLVCLAALGSVIFLWTSRWTTSTYVGEIQAASVSLSSTLGGRLIELRVSDFESVTNGQVLARVSMSSPEAAEAELAVLRADLEVLRVRMGQHQQRTDLSFQQARLDLQMQRLELASAQIRLQQAEAEYQRMSKLYEARVVSSGATERRNEFGYDVAIRDRDLLQKEVEAKNRMVTDLEQALERLRPADAAGKNPAIDAAISAAIKAQETNLKQSMGSETLRSPIDGMVSKVLRRQGENVAAGEALVEIGGVKPERIIGFMRQPMAFEPQVDDVVEVRTRARNPQVALAKVLRVGTRYQAFTQSLRVRGYDASMERGIPVLLNVPESITVHPGELVDLVPKAR